MSKSKRQSDTATASQQMSAGLASGSASASSLVAGRWRPNPSRVVLTPDATHAGGGFPRASAGSPSDLARAVRVYGGDTLENQLIDAQASLGLTAGVATVAGIAALLIAGEGIPVLPLIFAGLCFVLLLMFWEAVSRRNRIQRRLDDVDARVTAALAAALVVEVSDLVGAS